MFYNKIVDDIGELPNFLNHFEKELDEARHEVKIHGLIEKNIRDLPGVTEHRFNQLQEIEAVLNFMNIQLRKLRRKHFQDYLEHYQKALSAREVDKYVDGEEEVVQYETLINEVALMRNKWLGLMKGLESKNFMLGHLTKLKSAGMEDYTI